MSDRIMTIGGPKDGDEQVFFDSSDLLRAGSRGLQNLPEHAGVPPSPGQEEAIKKDNVVRAAWREFFEPL